MCFNLVYFCFFVPFFLVKQLQLDLFVQNHMLKRSHLMEMDFLLHIIKLNCSKMWEIKNLKIQWNAKIKQGKRNYSPNCRLQFPFGSSSWRSCDVQWRMGSFFFPHPGFWLVEICSDVWFSHLYKELIHGFSSLISNLIHVVKHFLDALEPFTCSCVFLLSWINY